VRYLAADAGSSNVDQRAENAQEYERGGDRAYSARFLDKNRRGTEPSLAVVPRVVEKGSRVAQGRNLAGANATRHVLACFFFFFF